MHDGELNSPFWIVSCIHLCLLPAIYNHPCRNNTFIPWPFYLFKIYISVRLKWWHHLYLFILPIYNYTFDANASNYFRQYIACTFVWIKWNSHIEVKLNPVIYLDNLDSVLWPWSVPTWRMKRVSANMADEMTGYIVSFLVLCFSLCVHWWRQTVDSQYNLYW